MNKGPARLNRTGPFAKASNLAAKLKASAKTLVERLFLEPRFERIGYGAIVLFGKRKMGISFDADVGQMHDFRIAAVAVDGFSECIGHHRCGAPVVIVRVRGRRLRNEVAVVNHDREFRELQKVLERHFVGFEVSEKARVLDGARCFAFGDPGS